MDKRMDLQDVIPFGSICVSETRNRIPETLVPLTPVIPRYGIPASSLRYLDMPLQCSKSFRRSHSRRINCVSISTCSRYVATGAHELAVWDLGDTTKAACIVPTGEVILCLSWIESNMSGWTLACGLHNGVLLTLSFKRVRVLSSFAICDRRRIGLCGGNCLSTAGPHFSDYCDFVGFDRRFLSDWRSVRWLWIVGPRWRRFVMTTFSHSDG